MHTYIYTHMQCCTCTRLYTYVHMILCIIYEDEHNAPPYTGTVISVGPKITDPDIAVGARLLWHDLAGFNIDMDGEKIYSIREQDVVAVVEKNSEIL